MKNHCNRTGRACQGGAFDDGDGWGIDCPMADPTDCPHRGDGPQTGWLDPDSGAVFNLDRHPEAWWVPDHR